MLVGVLCVALSVYLTKEMRGIRLLRRQPCTAASRVLFLVCVVAVVEIDFDFSRFTGLLQICFCFPEFRLQSFLFGLASSRPLPDNFHLAWVFRGLGRRSHSLGRQGLLLCRLHLHAQVRTFVQFGSA